MPDAGFEATGSLFWQCRKHWRSKHLFARGWSWVVRCLLVCVWGVGCWWSGVKGHLQEWLGREEQGRSFEPGT